MFADIESFGAESAHLIERKYKYNQFELQLWQVRHGRREYEKVGEMCPNALLQKQLNKVNVIVVVWGDCRDSLTWTPLHSHIFSVSGLHSLNSTYLPLEIYLYTIEKIKSLHLSSSILI